MKNSLHLSIAESCLMGIFLTDDDVQPNIAIMNSSQEPAQWIFQAAERLLYQFQYLKNEI